MGDSILDSINTDGANVNREGRDIGKSGDYVASWAEHSLPPDQVRGASQSSDGGFGRFRLISQK